MLSVLCSNEKTRWKIFRFENAYKEKKSSNQILSRKLFFDIDFSLILNLDNLRKHGKCSLFNELINSREKNDFAKSFSQHKDTPNGALKKMQNFLMKLLEEFQSWISCINLYNFWKKNSKRFLFGVFEFLFAKISKNKTFQKSLFSNLSRITTSILVNRLSCTLTRDKKKNEIFFI